MEKNFIVMGRKYGTTEWHIIPKLMTEDEAIADAQSRYQKNRGFNNTLGYEYTIAALDVLYTLTSNGAHMASDGNLVLAAAK